MALSKAALLFLLLLLPFSLEQSLCAQGMSAGFVAKLPTLQQLARRSGYIFSGTVVSVQKVAPRDSNSVATVAITFRVQEAVRGVRAGQDLVIREWSGLWNAGERYQKGEQVFLYLYPPSKLGLTSTVDGPAGRFAIDRSGSVDAGPGRNGDAGDLLPLVRKKLAVHDFAKLARRAAEE